MALDNVVEDILENARKEADQILNKAENDKNAIIRQATEEISRRKSVKQTETEEEIKRLRQQEISSAELEEKRIVLNARKEMLDRTFEEVNRQLQSLGPDDRKRLYNRILEKGREVIPEPKVYCPEGEAKLLAIRRGEKVEEIKMGAGLILESKDGTVRMDYSFRTILDSIWEKELKEISGVLFG